MVFEFLGGLGIFLFGIKFMGDGLQKSTGDRLRQILNRLTTNPVMGILAGIIVTMIIQSSSATTVITVGLVSAGFMTLRQAIGVIMGANIGTTITAFIIGINIGVYSLPIMALGAFLLFFFKNHRINNIAQIVFGLGSLFYGIEIMSDGMKPLRNLEAFQELMVNLSSSPILGILVGIVFTIIVQSSSTTIGVLQGLFSENLINLSAALPVLFGDNIGTTITAVLASIGSSIAAKRAAVAHVLFNLIGTFIFMLLIQPFSDLLSYLQTSMNLSPEMTIAFAHGIFNTTNTLLQLPFIGVLVFLVTKLIHGKDAAVEYKPKHLDPMFIEQSPSIALGQAKEEVLRMGNFSVSGLERTNQFLKTNQHKYSEKARQLEEAINHLDREITEYLVAIAAASLSEHESKEHSTLVSIIRDIERIGDHFENIIELVEYQQANQVTVTESALVDLDKMFELTITTVQESLYSLDQNDRDVAKDVIKMEKEIDTMERNLRRQHIIRLNEGECTGQAGIVYVDILSNLKRIGDHAVNIAESVLADRY